ncbi:CubicO group peptidase (beta-lactamase class C family) [Microbacterium marinum]|uniref:CubicO group peptidase (Beta-lactamase class C family) n=1 Tax=Microbacterium marinum TaxID=421115 RepID=A0A7W7BPZ2_9MICO|nr:serine hydrolase domain-containing protein [Microbacterium marinum]MBB4665791.1 CubicO group peptidase (beta-lactamase class C family) [Microbacterium marinum]
MTTIDDLTDLDAATGNPFFSGVASIDVGDSRVYERAGGFANRAHRVPITPVTRLAIASGSKIFTALAVLRLVEEGTLTLDQPVRTVLGSDLPLIDDGVTIEHLLSHTSGIGDYIDESAGGEIDDYIMTLPVHTLTTAEAFLPMLDGREQVSAPGEEFAYNNSGYVVLAVVIERATGETFHDVVRRLVLDPAGLSLTDYDRSDYLTGDVALGYLDEDGGHRTNVLHLPVLGNGDGGAYTTTGDLHRFWRALVRGDIVSPETYRVLVAPRHHDEDEGKRFGLAVWLHEVADVLVLEGYDAGVSFVSSHDPAADATYTVIANSSEGAWPAASAMRGVLEARLGI